MRILKLNLSRKEDPTGQGRNRANLNKKIRARLANAQSEVIRLFKAIPRKSKVESNLSLNQETFTTYEYEATPESQDSLETAIQALIALWLLQGNNQDRPFDYYADANVEESYLTGTLETIRDTNQDLNKIAVLGVLLASMPRSIDKNTVVLSQSYMDKLAKAKNDMYYELKGLSSKTSAQVYERINSGMKAGKAPREIIKDIKKRFAVSESGAKRIVVTQINRINSDAIMDTIEHLDNNTLLNVAGKHISALIPTTRPHHAARHENIYTNAQQSRWWDEGANRINCHCSFRVVILDDNKKEILS